MHVTPPLPFGQVTCGPGTFGQAQVWPLHTDPAPVDVVQSTQLFVSAPQYIWPLSAVLGLGKPEYKVPSATHLWPTVPPMLQSSPWQVQAWLTQVDLGPTIAWQSSQPPPQWVSSSVMHPKAGEPPVGHCTILPPPGHEQPWPVPMLQVEPANSAGQFRQFGPH